MGVIIDVKTCSILSVEVTLLGLWVVGELSELTSTEKLLFNVLVDRYMVRNGMEYG